METGIFFGRRGSIVTVLGRNERAAPTANAIERQIALGCDGVKIAMDHDMMDENTPQYTPETTRRKSLAFSGGWVVMIHNDFFFMELLLYLR